ncbi:hypothetical protein H0H92_005498 [Tricholoma furcatifolium]|nr:hypothetical protein H0H92_005498 [Tricholoma furcatifolium]
MTTSQSDLPKLQDGTTARWIGFGQLRSPYLLNCVAQKSYNHPSDSAKQLGLCLGSVTEVNVVASYSDSQLPHLLTFNTQTTLWPNSKDALDLNVGFHSDTVDDISPVPATLKTRPTKVFRPRSLEALHRARLRSLHEQQSEEVEWDELTVDGPDVENIHTLGQLARMSGNAYALPGQKNWYDIDRAWNISFPFGWEDADDGFRGHVFFSSDNSTLVLAIKGTTLNGPTSKKDKFNDNL